MKFERNLVLPEFPERSLFLWGARQTGKSTLLKQTYENGLWFNLLKSEVFSLLASRPESLREQIRATKSKLVVIDEIQKIPALLDEVHYLIEEDEIKFILCGSSARKVKRGHANLLGGRALRYELTGLSASEIGEDFDIIRLLNHGYLPSIYSAEHDYSKLLESYVGDYLKEEIAEEGLVRSLPNFSSFLRMIALSDTEQINYSGIARECAVSATTVKEYFQILLDTLLGSFVEGYQKRPKRRAYSSPKFYFFDVGVIGFLTKRGVIQQGSELFGKAFENWVYHELYTYSNYKNKFANISYWRLTSGAEVDFVVNDLELVLEVKGTSFVRDDHLKGLRSIKDEYKNIKKRVIVSCDQNPRETSDGILILPYKDFVQSLWSGDFF